MPAYFQTKRWLADKQGENILVLDDGSMWEITSAGRERTKWWIRFSNIEMHYSNSNSGAYPCVLFNTSYGEKVSAKFMGLKNSGSRPAA